MSQNTSTHNSEPPQSVTSSSSSESASESSDDDQSIAEPLLSSPKSKSQQKRGNKKQSAARTNEAGLSVPLQKELVQDIESLFGGLEEFKKDPFGTAKLCDRKSDAFGVSGSKLRQRVRDKLKQWKKLSLKECEDILIHLGFWATRRRSESTSNQNDTGNSNTNIIAPDLSKQTATAPIPVKSVTLPSTNVTPDRKTQTTMDSKNNAFTVKVNTANPEANREVIIYELERIEGVASHENKLFKGFWVTTPIDIRFILDDENTPHWKARVFNSNTVLLSMQAWNYSHLYDQGKFKAHVSENCIDAMEGAHHDIVDDEGVIKEDRKWKHLFLEFPNEVDLSAKAINEHAGDDEKLGL